jgi:hypothetical protein
MSVKNIAAVISKYVPHGAVEICSRWIIEKNIHLKLTRGRASKFGDYLPLEHGDGHRITVNHDLNKYAFLITYIHEVAHLETFNKFKNRVDPHGPEWKNEFRLLLKDFVQLDIFPDDVKAAVTSYMSNPAASSCSDLNLLRTLRKYDERIENVVHLEDVPHDTIFQLHQSRSGLIFRKGHQIRKRFHCEEINTKKIYLVSPVAEVVLVNN